MVFLTLSVENWIAIVALIPILIAILGIFFKAGKLLEKIEVLRVNQVEIKTEVKEVSSDIKEVRGDLGNVKVDVGKVQAEMNANDNILKLLNKFLNKGDVSTA